MTSQEFIQQYIKDGRILENNIEVFEGDLNLIGLDLVSLKNSPKKVTGWFYCSYNDLTSLEGAPEYVGESFYCYYSNLTSLRGAPKHVGGWFSCSHNNLTSLEGAPEYVGGWFISDIIETNNYKEVLRRINLEEILKKNKYAVR